MTLISCLWYKDTCIIAGEGATISDNFERRDAKLQKVYINQHSIIAFAGEVWLNEELMKRNIYVPNLIEDFQKEEIIYDNGIILANELSSRLKKYNDNIDCELFIAIKKGNSFDLLVHKTLDTSNTTLIPKENFSILFSKHNERENNWLNDLHKKEWQVFFNITNDGYLKYVEEYHSVKNLCEFTKHYFSKAHLFWDYGFVIGKSVDIAVLNNASVWFYQKENRSAYEY